MLSKLYSEFTIYHYGDYRSDGVVHNADGVEVLGESFEISVKLSEFPLVECSWQTKFESEFEPETKTEDGKVFIAADVDQTDLFSGFPADIKKSLMEHVVFKKGNSTKARINALRKLNDEEIFKNLALNDDNKRVRNAAVLKITDRKLLASIAVDIKEWVDIRKNALGKISDQEVLEKIALGIPGEHHMDGRHIREAATRKLIDQEILRRLALKLEWLELAKTAVERISDQRILGEISLTPPGGYSQAGRYLLPAVQVAAVRKLLDKKILLEIALKDTCLASVREAAIGRLTDQRISHEIMRTRTSEIMQRED